MTSKIRGLRLARQIIAWVGALYQSFLLLAAGFLVILLAWAYGRILPKA